MDDLMIKIDNVKKKYKLGQIGGTTLREELQRKIAKARGKDDPTAKIGAKQYSREEFWALNGISFDVKKGERVGIIGHNGAGKSTLLKLISRITAPTEGAIGLNGRITSMLEVGTGFHGELTGRENIYMNGAILGMTKKEIDQKMEQIIEFSEVRQFIDTPVKRYSSGMYVKLAFSVAAHLDSEIMIMDEVLAVGDVAFQNKCIDKMNEVSKQQGRTVLYVSHNMNTVRKLCERVVVLDHGEVVFDGPTEAAIKIYLKQKDDIIDKPYMVLTNRERPPYSKNMIIMNYIEMIGKEDIVFVQGDIIHFKLGWTSRIDLEDLRIQLIFWSSGSGVGSAFSPPFTSAKKEKKYTTFFDLDTSLFSEGKYIMTIALYHSDTLYGTQYHYDFVNRVCAFQITPRIDDEQYVQWHRLGWGTIRLPDITATVKEDKD